jgi:hypothetical protein
MVTEEQGTADTVAELPTTQFTAINGKEQRTMAMSNDVDRESRESQARCNGLPRTFPPGQESLTITTTMSQVLAAPANWDTQSSQPSPLYSNAESLHGWKRSGSIEQDLSSASSHSQAVLFSTKQTPTATSESYSTQEEDLADSRRETAASDLWRTGQYAQQTHVKSAEQLGEVRQSAFQSVDAQHRDYSHTCPANDDKSANPSATYGHDRTEEYVQSDLKQRKRQFSNRTKTGCMTCRKRKKKCDETRPECEETFWRFRLLKWTC